MNIFREEPSTLRAALDAWEEASESHSDAAAETQAYITQLLRNSLSDQAAAERLIDDFQQLPVETQRNLSVEQWSAFLSAIDATLYRETDQIRRENFFIAIEKEPRRFANTDPEIHQKLVQRTAEVCNCPALPEGYAVHLVDQVNPVMPPVFVVGSEGLSLWSQQGTDPPPIIKITEKTDSNTESLPRFPGSSRLYFLCPSKGYSEHGEPDHLAHQTLASTITNELDRYGWHLAGSTISHRSFAHSAPSAPSPDQSSALLPQLGVHRDAYRVSIDAPTPRLEEDGRQALAARFPDGVSWGEIHSELFSESSGRIRQPSLAETVTILERIVDLAPMGDEQPENARQALLLRLLEEGRRNIWEKAAWRTVLSEYPNLPLAEENRTAHPGLHEVLLCAEETPGNIASLRSDGNNLTVALHGNEHGEFSRIVLPCEAETVNAAGAEDLLITSHKLTGHDLARRVQPVLDLTELHADRYWARRGQALTVAVDSTEVERAVRARQKRRQRRASSYGAWDSMTIKNTQHTAMNEQTREQHPSPGPDASLPPASLSRTRGRGFRP